MDAVVLAAGEGTRLRPLTCTKPKPMLPIGGKPILEWNLEALDCAGVKRVFMVVGYRKESIMDHFGKTFRGMKISYVEQTSQLGTGDAVNCAKDRVEGDFIVMNGDLFITRKFVQTLVRDHKKNKPDISMSVVEVTEPRAYGVVEVDGKNVRSLTEKPKRPKSNLANAGVYIFKQSIFDMLDNLKRSSRMEYELTDAIKNTIKTGKVMAFMCEGQWMDIGMAWNLLDANEILMRSIKLKKSKKCKIEKYVTIKGDVHIGSDSLIKSGTYIEGPVFIGDGCTIGPNCYLRAHSVIMDNCKVGNAVELKNTILMPHTNVGHLSYVGDSIIGEGCNFGAGTKVANLRFDDAVVKMEVKQKMVGSGRRKLGCIMGDGVKTGINVSIMPGRSIYPVAYVDAASVVRNTIYTE